MEIRADLKKIIEHLEIQNAVIKNLMDWLIAYEDILVNEDCCFLGTKWCLILLWHHGL